MKPISLCGGAAMSHEDYVRKIVTSLNKQGLLKSRESYTVEFKQSFNGNNLFSYAKTMAAFANNRGGYIIFGVTDNPRRVIGIKINNFENFNQEKFTGVVNSLFSPELVWECGTFILHSDSAMAGTSGEQDVIAEKNIGWIYTEEAEYKPVIAQKSENGEKINNGDVYYRYRARNEKIKFSEMNRIVDERVTREREHMLKLFEVIRKKGATHLGIVDYGNGKFTTPYGIDVAIDRKLVTKVLRKAKFIKEGSFNETEGIPVIKVTGNIDLAEEIPVPEIDPDTGYPYIQKTLAEKLDISTQDLYALVWYYKMKEAKKYSISVTTSTSKKSNPVYKFSDFALQFLGEKLAELNVQEHEFERIRLEYRNRNNESVCKFGK